MSLFTRLFGGVERGVAKVRDAEGFRAATSEELYGQYANIFELGRDADVDVDKLVQFIKAAEAAIAQKAVLPHGVRVGAVAHLWAGEFETWLGEKQREDFAAPFQQAHEQCNSPMSAALYAQVCNALAFDARGSDWAQNVSDKAWENMFKWQTRALNALSVMQDDYDAQVAAGEGHIYQPWATVYFNIAGTKSGGSENLISMYEDLSVPDPDDLYLMMSAGQWLIPRWSGEPLEVFDSFARYCMDRTKERYGRGAYSYVYRILIEYNDIEDTPCDPLLLDAGWSDLRERFPCVRLQNFHVAAQYWAGLYPQAWAELSHNMRAIDAGAWSEESADQAMEKAVKTYINLKKNLS